MICNIIKASSWKWLQDNKIDDTLILKSRGKELLIFQVYVDDIIFGATLDALFKDFATLMENEF